MATIVTNESCWEINLDPPFSLLPRLEAQFKLDYPYFPAELLRRIEAILPPGKWLPYTTLLTISRCSALIQVPFIHRHKDMPTPVDILMALDVIEAEVQTRLKSNYFLQVLAVHREDMTLASAELGPTMGWEIGHRIPAPVFQNGGE